MRNKRASAILCALAAVAPALAQERAAEVVVSAAGIEQALVDAIPATSVITRERIEAAQTQDVITLLRREAGIEISQNGGQGTVAGVFMRGNGSATRTLILVDGVRMDSLTTGTMAIQNMLASQIERVEIVRGNVSALYGSQAMGGVIQIFTRQGSGPPAAGGEVQVGSRDTRSVSAGVSGQARDTRFALNVSHLTTGGFSAIDPGTNAATRAAVNPDRDGYRNLSVSGNIAHAINRDHRVGMRLFRTEGYANFDSAFGTPLTTHYSDSASESASLYWNARWMPRWSTELTHARGKDFLKTYTNGVNGAFDSLVTSTTHQWTLQNRFLIADGHHLNVGYESQRAGIDTPTAYARKTRSSESFVAGYNGVVGIAEAQFNLRRDAYSDFGRKESYYAGLGLNIAEGWKIIASGSSAFRAPNFNELFSPFGGNANLKPEYARSNEAAVQWNRGQHLARLSYFETRYRDFINIFPIVNIPGATVKGFEGIYAGRIAGFDVRASVTVQDPLDQVANAPLIRQSRRFGSLGLGRSVGAWTFGMDWRGSGERRDNAIAGGGTVELPHYQTFDLTARYAIDRQWSVGARLENAADQRYMIAHGYNTPRRGVFVTLAYSPR